MAKQYYEISVDEWNVNHFFGYMDDLTDKKFGVNYAPMRSWNFERGLIGNIVGTKKKQGSHERRLIKAFIDLTFSEYKATEQYPAPTFGFLWTYRQSDLQRAQKQLRSVAEASKSRELISNDNSNDLDDWFLS
ncbi:hypothetical protein [Staphylococcus felis]|uniref:Uncharacterized protein n=1 Tax=Staphylococcus felis TaxID=46127 RepID=A0ABS0QLI5_9STAP|nr:hypothetical protein [Staphylococcus felis]AVP37475.1 hypothetical protein C7J90_11095 [Staphylococcus felis]MBH9580066.1 hypothetical protein [Staphylococcus felis]PNZ34101.1 hypothetical protein CD143_10025 [Staphylococcus felis]QQB02576.1 hypothetical protein I6H71_07410 [Staphylococcus felis]REI05453.1 hypothetical protein DOS69_10145 [Staphylococcus felis]